MKQEHEFQFVCILCCRTVEVFTFHIKYEILYLIIMFVSIILVWFPNSIPIIIKCFIHGAFKIRIRKQQKITNCRQILQNVFYSFQTLLIA